MLPCWLSVARLMLFGAMLWVSGCGTENVFEVLQEPDDKKQGEAALAKGNYDEAIDRLEAALRENPSDVKVRKMLATSYMAKAQVDSMKILQTIASGKQSSDWGTLIGAMPDGTAQNQENLLRAVTLLDAIPLAERTEEERYQMAMAQTSLAVVTAKKYGVDEQGRVPEENVAQVSDGDAELIVEQLAGAGQNLTGVGDGSAQSASTKINNVVTQLNESQGSTSGEKVRNFLASKSG
jgi:tetratricopeptide (TPR) repeat protein